VCRSPSAAEPSILSILAEQAGTVVTHQELIARVWPTTVVEEANLRVHVASLRKVLGDSLEEPRFIASFWHLANSLTAAGAADESDGIDNVTAAITTIGQRFANTSVSFTA
jgi:hypothetical protein